MSVKRISAIVLLCLVVFSPEAEARRRSVRALPPKTVEAFTEGGYTNTSSVAQGGTLDFHIATSATPFTLEIVNLARPNDVVQSIPNLTSTSRDCTGLFEEGCGWPVTTRFAVPADWPSGFYAARFPTAFGRRYAFFVVKARQPGSSSRTLVVSSTHTFQAYNNFGNKNVYPSRDPFRAHRVSYQRPYVQAAGLGKFPIWEQPFVDWMTRENRPYEAATDVDLEDPTLLGNYNLVVFVGHSEYWTAGARGNVETFNANGGHLAILGGNTMWWQARLEDNLETLVVYKDDEIDPEFGRNNAVVTTNWYRDPVYRPENLITGTSFRNGEYVNRDRTAPVEQRIPWTVTDPNAWVFAGAGAQLGQTFGKQIAGLEVDGALYNCNAQGFADSVDGSDGTPLNFHIIATIPASNGHGTIGYYTNASGGTVFNGATQDWVLGLANDPLVLAATRNVLNRLSTGERLPYDPVDAKGVRMRDYFNCALDTTESKVVPGWQGSEGDLEVTSGCSYEGPRGLELGGADRVQISRDFSPTGNVLDRAEVRFYVRADQLKVTSVFAILMLQHRQSDRSVRRARIEMDGATKSVRAVQFDDEGNTGSRSDWVPLGSSGWHSIELTWRSPGLIAISVDGSGEKTVNNASANQRVSELWLQYPGAPEGHLCVDSLAVGMQKIDPVAPLK